MDSLRKLLFIKGEMEVAFQVGSRMNNNSIVVKRIEKIAQNDYVVYASFPDSNEITEWKKLHIPDSMYRQEEYDYEISIAQ